MKKRKNKGSRAIELFDYLHEHIIVIIIAVVVIAGLLSTLAIVRGDVAPAVKKKEETQEKYKTMNTIYLPMSPVRTLNPLESNDRDVYYISQLMYSSLFRLDENLNIEKDIVKSYKTDAKNGRVTLTLKDDVKFSDGSRLTAEDVRFTVNQILRIGKASPYYEYVSKIDSVLATGNRKLTIQFENPKDSALDNLVFPIVSAYDYDGDSKRVIGSGQYCYSSYDPMKALKLKPNKYYFGEKAENHIQFKILKDKSAVTGLMTTDYITACVNTSGGADADAEDKNLQIEKINSNELEFLGFNFRNPYLAKKEVRQAIAKSIDTGALISDNYGNSAVVSDSVYFPGFLGTENKGDVYEQNQKEAGKLLAVWGYKDIDDDGFLEDSKGRELSFNILVNSNNTGRSDTAYAIAENLRQAGIKVKVNSLSWDNYRKALKNRDFDMYLGGYKFDKKYNLTEMFRKGNYINYKNKEVLALVEKMETSMSAKQQKETFEQLKELLIEELPYYSICYKSYGFVTVNKFHMNENAEEGAEMPTFFDYYRGCSQWQWDKLIADKEEDKEKNKGKNKEK